MDGIYSACSRAMARIHLQAIQDDRMRILLIDNNDSFTQNLKHLLASSISGAEVRVKPYDLLATLDLAGFDMIVISPGPGTPTDYPGYERVFAAGRPVLGICLGMQIINEHNGGMTKPLPGCVHGKTETILFNGLKRVVARYHSLYVTKVGNGLKILSKNENNVPMCLGNRNARLLGYQFHPESFLTHDKEVFIDFALDYLGLG